MRSKSSTNHRASGPYTEGSSNPSFRREHPGSNDSTSKQVLVDAFLSQPTGPWSPLVPSTPAYSLSRSSRSNEARPRRRMSEGERQHYIDVRRKGACEVCRRGKRKCDHVIASEHSEASSAHVHPYRVIPPLQQQQEPENFEDFNHAWDQTFDILAEQIQLGHTVSLDEICQKIDMTYAARC